MKRVFPLAFLVLCVLLSLPEVAADDAVFLGYGASVFPAEEGAIELEYEQLTITYHPFDEEARVEAFLIFKNPGEAKTVLMGFPEALGHSPAEEEGFPTILDLDTTVDGVPVDTVYQPLEMRNGDFHFDRVYLWKVHFQKGESHTIKHTYRYKSSYDSLGYWYLDYILQTGALWAGKIGRIDIVVRSPVKVPWMEFVPYPEEYSYFHATEWEPDRDIRLTSLYSTDLAVFGKGEPVEGYYDEAAARKIYREAAVKRRAEIRAYIAALKPEYLSRCTKKEIQTYINGIYATYGRPFKDPAWAAFFTGKWWYEPDHAFHEGMLSGEDQKTIARLKTYVDKALTSLPIPFQQKILDKDRPSGVKSQIKVKAPSRGATGRAETSGEETSRRAGKMRA
ncbi:MAG: YARHG domain-containing protein [Firmicutes bacterium]|nr:YARHG domain-containing protein [Bacillota bacterium]